MLLVIYSKLQYMSDNKQVKMTHWWHNMVIFVLVVSRPIRFLAFIILKSTHRWEWASEWGIVVSEENGNGNKLLSMFMIC